MFCFFDQDEDVDSDRINYWSDTLGIQRQEFFKYSTKSISKINNENDNSTNVAKRKRKRVVVLDDDDVEEDSDYEVSVSKSKQQKKTNSAKRKSGFPSFYFRFQCTVGPRYMRGIGTPKVDSI